MISSRDSSRRLSAPTVTRRSYFGVWLFSILLGIGWLAAGASELPAHETAEDTSERAATLEPLASLRAVSVQRQVAGFVGESCSPEWTVGGTAAKACGPALGSWTTAAAPAPAHPPGPRLALCRHSAPARAPPS